MSHIFKDIFSKILEILTRRIKISFKRPYKVSKLTIIGEGNKIAGRLILKDKLARVDGSIKGELRSEGLLIIGVNGEMEGKVNTKKIMIYGIVKGSVYADEMVQIKKSGRLYADIFTSKFIVEEGGIFDGNCQRAF